MKIMFEFIFADKLQIEQLLPTLFCILHSNMSLIDPTNNTYDDDYEIWKSHIIPAMQKEQRKIVLVYANDILVGYFQYYIYSDTNSLMMKEIQIIKEYQVLGLFSAFYKWLVGQIPKDVEFVEAYANKKLQIPKHFGAFGIS